MKIPHVVDEWLLENLMDYVDIGFRLVDLVWKLLDRRSSGRQWEAEKPGPVQRGAYLLSVEPIRVSDSVTLVLNPPN